MALPKLATRTLHPRVLDLPLHTNTPFSLFGYVSSSHITVSILNSYICLNAVSTDLKEGEKQLTKKYMIFTNIRGLDKIFKLPSRMLVCNSEYSSVGS